MFPKIFVTIIIFNRKKRGAATPSHNVVNGPFKPFNNGIDFEDSSPEVVKFGTFDVEFSSLRLDNQHARLLTSRWEAWRADTFRNGCANLWRKSKVGISALGRRLVHRVKLWP